MSQLITTVVASPQVCQLCHNRTADHTWQNGRILRLCGRCMYWLGSNFKKAHTGKVGVVEVAYIIAVAANFRRNGWRLRQVIRVWSILHGCSEVNVRRIISGHGAYSWVYRSMVERGIIEAV